MQIGHLYKRFEIAGMKSKPALWKLGSWRQAWERKQSLFRDLGVPRELISEIAHFEQLLFSWQLVCFNKEVILPLSFFPSSPMPLSSTEHISLSHVGVKAWEIFHSSFIPVSEAIYWFQGQPSWPAFIYSTRVSSTKTEWKTVGFLSSQMLLGLINT